MAIRQKRYCKDIKNLVNDKIIFNFPFSILNFFVSLQKNIKHEKINHLNPRSHYAYVQLQF